VITAPFVVDRGTLTVPGLGVTLVCGGRAEVQDISGAYDPRRPGWFPTKPACAPETSMSKLIRAAHAASRFGRKIAQDYRPSRCASSCRIRRRRVRRHR
jgi:hypothetical protein